MYNLGVVASTVKPFGDVIGDVVYRWVLTRKIGKKVERIAKGVHGYGRKKDAIRAFDNLSKIFDGTLTYTKNYD